ncbi:hypothetical protein SAMN05660862_0374 [Sphingobacterium psychroaquaticum]|uniref:Uncharacterized protein n=1 Tax=Sphingobacterium psychroaquaticum TaxID=561061 RepID=A0A1X7I1V3_9SPHI|nr:hypothetical protein SAMN05660862_0374 [Sphingobacterium psychroaquaticum]
MYLLTNSFFGNIINLYLNFLIFFDFIVRLICKFDLRFRVLPLFMNDQSQKLNNYSRLL